MIKDQITYDYSFPKAKVMYWLYFSPMIIIFVIYIIAFRHEIFTNRIIEDVYINLLCLFILSVFFMPIMAYIFANSFPAIRVYKDRLEIKIYSPIKTKWLSLQWKEIDKVEEYINSSQKIFRLNKKSFFITSKRIPFFYLILSILYRHSPKRGIIITPKITKYEELVNLILDNYVKYRQ